MSSPENSIVTAADNPNVTRRPYCELDEGPRISTMACPCLRSRGDKRTRHVVEIGAVGFATHRATLRCVCGFAAEGVAARRTFVDVELLVTTGSLDESQPPLPGHVQSRPLAKKHEEFIVFCAVCIRNADEDDWVEDGTISSSDFITTPTDVRVRCSACWSEVEFGWRGDCIVACDSPTFDPATVEPEPRFHEAWIRRGWL
jgi:hypothetical protein